MTKQCFVPFCSSGLNSQRKKNLKAGKKNPTLFKAPSDPNRLFIWERAIPRGDRKLQSSDSVCELHFEEHFIHRVDRVKLPGGIEYVSTRTVPRLDPQAVPSNFPNCPFYLSKKILKRKPPTERAPIIKKPRKRPETKATKNEQVCQAAIGEQQISIASTHNPSISELIVNVDVDISDGFTFLDLKKELGEFYRNSWSMVVMNDIIRYMYWSPDVHLLPTKYLEIDQTLSVKLIFGNVSTQYFKFTVLKSRNELDQLFDVMEMSVACPGALINKYKNCRGYIPPLTDEVLCRNCKRDEKVEKTKLINCENCKKTQTNARRRGIRLKKKVILA